MRGRGSRNGFIFKRRVSDDFCRLKKKINRNDWFLCESLIENAQNSQIGFSHKMFLMEKWHNLGGKRILEVCKKELYEGFPVGKYSYEK